MKKFLCAIIFLTLCGSVMMTSGCASDPRSNSSSVSNLDTGSEQQSVPDNEPVSDPDADFDLVPISEIRENFSQSIEEVRAGEFVNLDFSNAEFDFPEIDSISRLSLIIPSGKSPRELYDFYCECLDTLMPGVFSEEEKQKGLIFSDTNRDPYAPYLPIDEYELEAKDGALTMLFQNTNRCFMQGLWGTLEWFVSDDLSQWLGIERVPLLSDMDDEINYGTKAVDYVTDLNSPDKYELINGEMSIKDAAEFASSFLDTTVFSPYKQDAKTKLLAVDIVDIGNGKYGYGFITGYEYKNVLLDYPEMSGVKRGSGVLNDYDERHHSYYTGNISMIQTDKVFHFLIPVFGKSIEEVETYTSAITLQDAANITCDFYSDYMNFTVTKVEVVYLDGNIPCWKFIMRCSGNVYNSFVDMQTGEVYLYIQRGE